jgi:murein DD-endopeptidase MepM/ murein hydrolase activator NlpD
VLRHSRAFLFLFGIFILAVIIRNSPGPQLALDSLGKEVAMPFRLMHLQFQDPVEELLMPVQGVTVQRVADTWGSPRSGSRKHEGQDLFAPKGTPVVSATHGVVVRKGTGGLGGISVAVFGPGGRVYYYAHLDRWADSVEVGSVVQPGDLLGFVGNTGNARNTPPHLHFGVYSAGGAMDPLPMLRKAAEADTQSKAARSTAMLFGTAVCGGSFPSISSDTHPLKPALFRMPAIFL